MRDKNVRRAAHALYMSQGDDKNSKIAKKIDNDFVRDLVKDQGRALLILEKIILPRGKDAFDEAEMHSMLLKKLKKKGHRIQEDTAEDDEQYAKEKERWSTARQKKVPDIFEVGLGIKSESPQPKKPKNVREENPESISYNLKKTSQHLRRAFKLLFTP